MTGSQNAPGMNKMSIKVAGGIYLPIFEWIGDKPSLKDRGITALF